MYAFQVEIGFELSLLSETSRDKKMRRAHHSQSSVDPWTSVMTRVISWKTRPALLPTPLANVPGGYLHVPELLEKDIHSGISGDKLKGGGGGGGGSGKVA